MGRFDLAVYLLYILLCLPAPHVFVTAIWESLGDAYPVASPGWKDGKQFLARLSHASCFIIHDVGSSCHDIQGEG